MKKKSSIAIILVLIMLLCSVMLAAPSFAAEMPDGALPVTIKLEGLTLPDPEEIYLIKLEADDPAYPMPAESVDGVYTLSIRGAASESFPAISFSRVGIYTYTLYQESGTNTQAVYDDTIYLLTVYVTNKEEGEGLETQWILKLAGVEGKQDAVFTNYYESVAPITPPLIELEKLVQEKKFSKAGDLLHFSFVLKNVGVVPVVKFVVNDAKLGVENLLIDLSEDPLLPGESYTYKFVKAYVITEADVKAMLFKNTVKVVAESESGLKDEDEDDVTVPFEKIAPYIPPTGETRSYLSAIILLSLGAVVISFLLYRRDKHRGESEFSQ
ncbi:MAG: FctA domain-containing protein [Eubacteriales bacterium]|nr:FctA domain-containing protein [Eubacteriales bacterium]